MQLKIMKYSKYFATHCDKIFQIEIKKVNTFYHHRIYYQIQ